MFSRQSLTSSYFQRGGRRVGISSLALCVGLLSVMSVGSALAAQEGANDTRINVGIGAAKPGDPIDIPVTLSGGEQSQVGSVSIHVSFPKALLTFTEAERGLAVELADGDVKATLGSDSDDPSQSSLELAATGKNPIKPGILAYMKFRVSTEAQKGEIILKLKDYKATTAQGDAMQLAQGDNGQLTIFGLDEDIPVIGCFFFTH